MQTSDHTYEQGITLCYKEGTDTYVHTHTHTSKQALTRLYALPLTPHIIWAYTIIINSHWILNLPSKYPLLPHKAHTIHQRTHIQPSLVQINTVTILGMFRYLLCQSYSTFLDKWLHLSTGTGKWFSHK